MKAIVVTAFGGPETMKYTEVDMPTFNEKQVLIRVIATSVNFADIKSRYGKKGNRKLPFIPGIDAAGIVEQVGSSVKNIRVGQRVIAFPLNGSYAEYVVANENLTFVLPDEVDFTTAAACPVVSFTSYNLLANIARLQQGETVLIHAAAGGIGTTSIQLAKILGAGKIIGTVGNKAKKKVALEAGADHVICYQDEDFSKKANELTGGKGADVILDSISGAVSEKAWSVWLTMVALSILVMQAGKLAHFGQRIYMQAVVLFLALALEQLVRNVLTYFVIPLTKFFSIYVMEAYKLQLVNALHFEMQGKHMNGSKVDRVQEKSF